MYISKNECILCAIRSLMSVLILYINCAPTRVCRKSTFLTGYVVKVCPDPGYVVKVRPDPGYVVKQCPRIMMNKIFDWH